jgi:hypothetical protein
MAQDHVGVVYVLVKRAFVTDAFIGLMRCVAAVIWARLKFVKLEYSCLAERSFHGV